MVFRGEGNVAVMATPRYVWKCQHLHFCHSPKLCSLTVLEHQVLLEPAPLASPVDSLEMQNFSPHSRLCTFTRSMGHPILKCEKHLSHASNLGW